MGRRTSLVLLAAAVVLSEFAPTWHAASAAEPGLRPLHATHGAGARIVDDLGRTVILRGVNVNGLGEYYQEWPDLPSTLPLTDADFAEIAADGFNVVRLLITWSRLEPSSGAIDAAYLDRIAATVAMAKAHDIYVLLDMHQDAWGPHVDTPDGVTCPPGLTPAVGWDGAPEWATALVGTPLTCTIGGTRELSASAETSFTQFYADLDGVQQHLLDVWTAVARRFANEPAVAGYDLLNEPNPGMVPGVTDYTLLGAFYGRVIGAIRSVDAKHAIFFEPAVITGPLAVPAPLPVFSNDTNLVYAPHLYNESISILPGTIEDGFANAATAAARYGTTFFPGEWGWFGDSAAAQPFIERYASNEDAHMVGGTWWQWKQACGDPHAIGSRGHRPSCAGKSIYSDGLVTRAQKNVDVLTRAYPRAAPGTLTSINAPVAGGSPRVTG
ncbi:MAG: endoglycosylceramidase, partial [Actinomycetota bacterium]